MTNATLSAHNIVEVWDAATPEQLHAGRTWYDKAYETARRFAAQYGVSVEVAAGVLAALSPNNSWKSNVTMAERVLATGDTSRGYLKIGLNKARRILDGESPESVFESREYKKVANFYRAIVSRGTDGVCVDRHAWDVATGIRHADKPSENLPVRPKVSGARYLNAVATYEAAAAMLSEREGRKVTGCEVQAVTWIVWRRRFWGEGAFDVDKDEIGTAEFADMILAYLLSEEVAA